MRPLGLPSFLPIVYYAQTSSRLPKYQKIQQFIYFNIIFNNKNSYFFNSFWKWTIPIFIISKLEN